MNGKELFALAPFGAIVAFSDGTPRPPDRFTKKLSAWKSQNDAGVFVGRSHGKGAGAWDVDHFTLRTLESSVLVVNRSFNVGDADRFTITSPAAPGTIIAFSDFYTERGDDDCPYVWPSYTHAKAWGLAKGYDLSRQGWSFKVIGADGALEPFELPAPDGNPVNGRDKFGLGDRDRAALV